MSYDGLVLETCQRLGMRDPAELAALSGDLPDLWVAHTRNHLEGAYTAPAKKGGK